MILVDSSVWIGHLRARDDRLTALLEQAQVLAHPLVVGEMALGNLHQREIVLQSLSDLPQAEVAQDWEVLRFIGSQRLFGRGIGYIDAHLLAATRLTSGARLWTRDRRLAEVARDLNLASDV